MSLPVKFRQVLLIFIFGTASIAATSLAFAYQASLIPASRLINPDELVKILQSAKSEKPLMIQVRSHVLYARRTFRARNTLARPLAKLPCGRCASAWNLCRATNSSFSIAAVVRGVTVPTSSLPTTHCTPWVLPM